MIGMPGSMGRTSPAGSLPRATPPCCSQSAMHGARSTRWCTRAPLSPMPSGISGATSSSGNGRSVSTSTRRRRRGRARARHPRCGGEAQEGGERLLALGADPVQAEGQGRQGEVPQHPLGSMAGPLGFQESQRGGVLQRSSPPQQVFGILRPIPQLPGQEGWMGLRCHSGCHRLPGLLRGGEPTPPEPQRKADRAGEARTASEVPPAPEAPPPRKRSGPSQGTPEGRKHPFPPHPPRQWEDPPERPRGEDPPGKGSKGGKNRQAQGQMMGGQTKDTRNP